MSSSRTTRTPRIRRARSPTPSRFGGKNERPARRSRRAPARRGASAAVVDASAGTASLSLPSVVPADFEIDAYVVVNHYEDAGAPPCAITDEITVVRVP
jgi:hypothetical protein